MSVLDENPTALRIRQHLVEHLGAPDEVSELTGSPIPGSPVQALNLAYFAPQGPHAPVVFATCGAGLYRMPDGRRVEGLVLLRREPNRDAFGAVHRLLAQFALFSETSGQPVRLGDVVRAPDMLQPFCAMDAVLFIPPVPFVPEFHATAISADERVELVWLLPVYEAEADYAIEHGPQALMMLFAAQGLDLTEPDREEANTLIEPTDAEGMAQAAFERAQQQPQAPTPSSGGKTKTSRRDVNQGSFEVAETGQTLKITRRGGARGGAPKPAAKPVPKPPAAPPPAAPPPPASEATPMTRGPAVSPPPGARRPPPNARPVAVRPPSKKEEVRFDLARGPTSRRAASVKEMPAAAPRSGPKAGPASGVKAGAKPGPKGPLTSAPKPGGPAARPPREDPKVTKQKRVDALKRAAKEAAQRAAKRHSGEAPAAPPRQAPKPVAKDAERTSALRAAAKRRGAAQRVLRTELDDE